MLSLCLCSPMGCGGVQPPPAAMGSSMSSDSKTLGKSLCQDLSSGLPPRSPDPFAQCLGAQEPSWHCHSRVCKKMRARNPLQSWLRIATKQIFSFLFVPSSHPMQTRRSGMLSPVLSQALMEILGIFLAKALCIRTDCFFAAGTCKGRG